MTIKKNKQKAKMRAKEAFQKKAEHMKLFLEEKWKTNINYNCVSCLEIAYLSELENDTGYVTDEELITLSKGKLKHK